MAANQYRNNPESQEQFNCLGILWLHPSQVPLVEILVLNNKEFQVIKTLEDNLFPF